MSTLIQSGLKIYLKLTGICVFGFCLLFSGLSKAQVVQALGVESFIQDISDENPLLHYAPEEVNDENRKALNQIIAVDLVDVPREKALRQIADMADVKIAFSKSIAEGEWQKKITLQAEQATVLGALYFVLKDTDLNLTLSSATSRNSHIVVVNSSQNFEEKPEAVPVTEEWQESVSGYVTDAETGETLPGVNIQLVDDERGTTTDTDGYYSFTVPDLTGTLVFTYIGYERVVVEIDGRNEIDISMNPSQFILDEMVVVGYGEQKRSNLTGAISSVSVESIENRPQLRLDQALQGMAAGVTVTQSGGAPGAAPTIHIRGVGSISNTEPLWVVDGIRMETGNHLNISDIESIEILKDAASSAIYGARAAHGVILVTTKRGAGETRIDFRSSIGRRSPLNLPTLLGSADFVHYKRESRLNAGQNPEPSWDNWEHDTDWIDAYYAGSGVFSSNNISLSRGDERFNIYLSLGYDDETGILINNTLNRLTGRINFDMDVTSSVKVGTNVLLSKVTENPINNFDENETGAIPYRSIPIMPIYDDENSYGGWGRAPVYFQGPNPVASHYQQHETRNNNRIDSNLYLEIRPLDGLMFRGVLGYNTLGYTSERFNEAFDYGAFANTINSLTYHQQNHQTVSGSFTATYGNSIGRHNFQLMGGYEASMYDMEQFNVTGTDFPVDVAWSMNLATGAVNSTERFNVYQSRLLSQFGRVNYNFEERYLLELNIRRDASAPKFGPENIWGIFPSVSAGWNISNEQFFSDIPYLNMLRLRVSTGKLGSDNIGDYIYLRTYTSQFSTYAFDEAGQNKVSGFYLSRFPNEEVKWEEINMHNVGIDIGAFQNRFTMSVDYYIKDTKDLLYGVPIPLSVGIATHNFNPVNPQVNIGTMRNTGVDIQMGYRGQVNRFGFNINGNTSFLKNEMGSLDDGGYIVGGFGGGQIGGMTRTQPGMPISSFYGFRVRQILNSQGDVDAVNSWSPDGIYQEAGTGPGDFMYWDLGGPNGEPDGKVTAEHDRTFIGNPWPKMTYALNLQADYRNLVDISLQFQGVQGVDIFNADKAYTRNFFGDSNTTTKIEEAWRPDNHTAHPRNIASDPNGNFSKPSDYFVEDGSYLKLRNVQLGFNVPYEHLGRFGLRKLRLYVNANNIFTITGYTGLDPEVGGSNTGRGIDYGLYPHVRTITAGIEIQF